MRRWKEFGGTRPGIGERSSEYANEYASEDDPSTRSMEELSVGSKFSGLRGQI